MTAYRSPRLLEPGDVLDAFSCASVEQTEWLRHHAHQSHATGSTKVLVVTTVEDPSVVVAYVAWAMASIGIDRAPARLRKGAGRYPQPVALLARLAVDESHERRGLGAGLLADIVRRTAELGGRIGCRGLLIHAESEAARDFYRHLVPEFELSPTDPLHLLLLMKDIRRTINAARP